MLQAKARRIRTSADKSWLCGGSSPIVDDMNPA